MNFTEHKQSFIQEMRRRNYSENTIENYVSNLMCFFSWSKKDHPKNINEQDIKNYLSRFDEPNTQRSHHGAIKLFYKICLNQPNKFKYIPYCRRSKKLPIVLSQSEVQRIFDACDNLKHRAILALMYATGMRVGEVINLKPEHIDSSRMIINIIQGKGKKDRQVMLPESLLHVLRAYYRKYRPVEYLFNGQNNAPQYSERSINEFIKTYSGKAGIQSKRVYAHLFRHSSFTHMVENNVDINLIQRIAGHSNVKTTMTYCHVSNNIISKIQSPLQFINLQ